MQKESILKEFNNFKKTSESILLDLCYLCLETVQDVLTATTGTSNDTRGINTSLRERSKLFIFAFLICTFNFYYTLKLIYTFYKLKLFFLVCDKFSF